MKKGLTYIAAVLFGLLTLANTISAHHGTAAYDTTKPVTFNGTVTQFQYINPHVLISFSVKTDQGKTETWEGELTSPNRLTRAGWSHTTLKPGDPVTITGFRPRGGAHTLWLTKVIANGEELKLDSD